MASQRGSELRPSEKSTNMALFGHGSMSALSQQCGQHPIALTISHSQFPGRTAQPRLPGTEFLDAETKRQKSSFKRANACRDQIQELSGQKSAQKRPIWRRL